ncbi:DUF2079 domain-containing protein [Actinoplanes sp. NPDC049265]|uniref:DUF2079 domain-containing protein n=1 Tax=Actinoplanes sp. NPDC049265 TaxID=3363902 RepID=UPI0037179890
MSVTATAPAESSDPPAEPAAPSAVRRRWPGHLIMAAVSVAVAVYVTQGLWADPYGKVLQRNAGDQAFFEWLLGYGWYLLSHGADPFFTDMMNAPDGVNLAANTSITVYIVALAPISHFLGPQVSFVIILTANLAAAAFVWYLFLLRHATTRRGVAAVAGLFCGFAPGFVSHANGHLNWSAGWIAPLVLWWVLKLREDRWIRNGLVLGLLVAAGFSIAAEGLFFTALASAVFLAAWALAPATRAEARGALTTMLKGLGVTAVVAGALLAYPLYMHFAGPQSFSGTGFNQRHYVEDVASYLSYAERSFAGWAGLDSAWLAPNPTEETSFFGLPMVVLIIAGLVTLWKRADAGRRATLRALIVVAVTFVVLSWGPRLQIFEQETPIPLPYAALAHLPLFDSALPARFALVLVGVFGVVLAMLGDLLLRDRTIPSAAQTAFGAAYAVALVPIMPLPLLTTTRAVEPQFIADGTWKRYVDDDASLSSLPFASNLSADAQRWQAYTMARGGKQFRIPDGYFLGPGGHDGTGQIGARWHWTDWLLARAGRYGEVPQVTEADRIRAREDLAHWNIQGLFLADRVTGADGPEFRAAIELTARDLFGEPERVDDVLFWRIRPGVDPVTPGQ